MPEAEKSTKFFIAASGILRVSTLFALSPVPESICQSTPLTPPRSRTSARGADQSGLFSSLALMFFTISAGSASGTWLPCTQISRGSSGGLASAGPIHSPGKPATWRTCQSAGTSMV